MATEASLYSIKYLVLYLGNPHIGFFVFFIFLIRAKTDENF